MMDSLGANISTQIGTVQIRGRDITLSNYDLPEFLVNCIGAGVEIGFNSGLLGAGMYTEYNATNASSVKLTLDSLIKLKNIIKKIVGQVNDVTKVKKNNEVWAAAEPDRQRAMNPAPNGVNPDASTEGQGTNQLETDRNQETPVSPAASTNQRASYLEE
jgi:hypothetical protein